MNRREFVAGIGSVGVLAGAGSLLWRGPPSFGDEPGTAEDEASNDPLEVETIDARGSEAGTITVPDETVTAILFFTTGCGNCQAQMPRLAEAREGLVQRHGDAVGFLSVTYQTPETMPADDLREWWATHSGDWPVGYDSGLARSYGAIGFPVTIVVGSDGEKHWERNGIQEPGTITDAVESVLEGEE
ncbi:redoxin domain-containing protein [Natronorubrum sp. JWXQ-INN-674]|uniref:Redoxin domain-containing protein n=1 Tax=Natronorubrum halalkaliphilum TaxID=2691917 RepID=A0A6B0VMI3_9EURY|nr:TlpA disulfide reductase family protein [Natronorubrum halalkaliphilum]MXV62375.1 redoxin domain-containing protein [Natronorubrum halalkaliphilum]